MRIARFDVDGVPTFASMQPDGTAIILGGAFPDFTHTARKLDPAQHRLLAPLVPTDILCIGLNYHDHAKESGSEPPEHPMLFIKASNTLNHPGGEVRIPRRSDKVDYEGELTVIIGQDTTDVAPEQALDAIFGYTIANDVSARDWQREKRLGGGQYARGKSFDGFCPIGPHMVTKDEVADPSKLQIRTTLNGQVMQDASTSLMIFDVAALISSLSSTMTLRKGAVILSGTPAGVGFARDPAVYLKAGDVVEIDIQPIGVLRNTVV